MKKLFIAVPILSLLFFSSCKKSNEDLIVGHWEMTDLWIDNLEGTTQFADLTSYTCADNSEISYQPYYETESYSWNFAENGKFTWTELGTSYNLNPNACSGGAKLIPSDNNLVIETDWVINDEGKGEIITLSVDEGFFEVTIKELSKTTMTVEFKMPQGDSNYRVAFTKK